MKRFQFKICVLLPFLLLLLLLFANAADAQRDGWKLYDNTKYVDHITTGGDYTWVLSRRQGYVRLDHTTGEIRRYNVFNSTIPYNMDHQQYSSFATADHQGGLWIPLSFTELGYFDGEEMTVYTKEDFDLPAEASFIPVSDIFAASDGTMYFTTISGIVRYDGSDWEFTELFPIPMRLTEARDGTGNILAVANEDPFYIFGSYNGFYEFDGEEWHHYTTDNFEGLPSNRIDHIGRAADGELWMTNARENSSNFDRLRRFNGERWLSYIATGMGFPQITFGNRRTTAFHLDEQGGAWIAMSTAGSGVARFYDGSWTHFSFSNSQLLGNDVNTITTSPDGHILIGSSWNGTVTSDGGVQKVSGDDWETLSLTDNGPPSLAIRNLAVEIVDEQPHFWLATFHGLTHFDGSQWNTYTTENSGIADSFVDDVLVDDDGKIWAATAMGISVFDRNSESWSTWTMQNTDNGLPSNRILTLLNADNGGKWIGTDAGFTFYDGDTWETFVPDPLPDNFRVFKSVIDGQGRYWAGTSHGVHVYDGETWTVYNHENSSLSNAWSYWIEDTHAGIMVINMRNLTSSPFLFHFIEDEQDFRSLAAGNSDLAASIVTLVSDFRYNSNLEVQTLLVGTPSGLQEMFFDETGYLRQISAYKDFDTSPKAPSKAAISNKYGPDEILGDFTGPHTGFNAYFMRNLVGTIMVVRTLQGLLLNPYAGSLFDEHAPNRMVNRYSFEITESGLYDSGSLVSMEVHEEVSENKTLYVEEFSGKLDDDDQVDTSEMNPLEYYFYLRDKDMAPDRLQFRTSISLLGHLLARGNKLADTEYLERASIYWRPYSGVSFKKLETEWDGAYLIAPLDSTGQFVVGIDPVQTPADDPGETIQDFFLYQNYPNPFNPSTTIRYRLPVSSDVRLEVFDILGRRVAVLVDDFQQSGHHQIDFDATQLASGVYIYRLQVAGPNRTGADVHTMTRKLTHVK